MSIQNLNSFFGKALHLFLSAEWLVRFGRDLSSLLPCIGKFGLNWPANWHGRGDRGTLELDFEDGEVVSEGVLAADFVDVAEDLFEVASVHSDGYFEVLD